MLESRIGLPRSPCRCVVRVFEAVDQAATFDEGDADVFAEAPVGASVRVRACQCSRQSYAADVLRWALCVLLGIEDKSELRAPSRSVIADALDVVEILGRDAEIQLKLERQVRTRRDYQRYRRQAA